MQLALKLTFRRGNSKGGNSKEIAEWGNQFAEGEGYVLPGDGNLDRPQSKMSEWGEAEKEERPKRKRRGKKNR